MKDIDTDDELVDVIDELKFRLKSGTWDGQLMKVAFNELLNQFIEDWGLNGDPDAFASIPDKKRHL
jgi:hypothetical protein